MKRANGQGTIAKLSGNRRKPYAVKITTGYSEKGVLRYKYISYHRTRREAEKALNDYIADPYTINNKTVSEIFDEWYKIQETKRAKNTLAGYRTHFNYLKPLHDTKIRNLDRYILKKYYDDLDVSKDSFNRIKNLLEMLIRYSVQIGICSSSMLNINDSILMPDKKESHYAPRSVITKQEIDKLWSIKDENEYARIILVYIYTGVRFSELRNLTADACHDDYIEIRKSKTAAGIRIVPLSDKVKSLLPIIQIPPHTSFWYIFKGILPNHVVHDTRHTFITMMTEAGIDPRVIKAIVGHKGNDVTGHYTHIGLDAMMEAVNKI